MLLLTKSIFAVMIGFFLSAILGFFIVPLFKRMHVGQRISSYVGENHKKKEGTPTMGGIIFILSTVIAMLVLVATGRVSYTSNLGIVLIVFIGHGLIGLLDDLLSIKKKNNEGLTVYQKLFLQVLIAILFFYIYMKNGGQTAFVVGTLHIDIEMGFLYGLFILLILVGSTNAVNLTDGLDGLAGGLSAIAMLDFALISLMVGYEDIGIFCLVLCGSLV